MCRVRRPSLSFSQRPFLGTIVNRCNRNPWRSHILRIGNQLQWIIIRKRNSRRNAPLNIIRTIANRTDPTHESIFHAASRELRLLPLRLLLLSLLSALHIHSRTRLNAFRVEVWTSNTTTTTTIATREIQCSIILCWRKMSAPTTLRCIVGRDGVNMPSSPADYQCAMRNDDDTVSMLQRRYDADNDYAMNAFHLLVDRWWHCPSAFISDRVRAAINRPECVNKNRAPRTESRYSHVIINSVIQSSHMYLSIMAYKRFLVCIF